ncbi:pilus assembly protein TadG-related protein [Pseudovibrio exalbescens]|uniref:VWFA domain-containing protein n=1 Tax=Pseudovibrio exalbescens TaxID=197461 RepID=A0A1U7JIU6_9HYPH|nr:pilus assembly protein TadG-related protein [Pseudovibrio exalbescens]OKL44618.1 hypothetical protein A3843_09595 [Pseudovibrio exalbescens]
MPFKRATGFLGCERGVVLPIAAVMIVILIVVAGAAIDFARAINTRQTLNHAMDNALLAVAREASTTIMTQAQAKSTFAAYFDANLQDGQLYDDVIRRTPEFSLDPIGGRVEASIIAEVPTFFIHHLDLMGYDTSELKSLSVRTSAQASFPTRNAEVTMVLDVTGSMRNHMTDLKKAAKNLVTTLLPDAKTGSGSRVRIALVPYSEGVNGELTVTRIGPDIELSDLVSNGQARKHCLTERMGDDSTTDAPWNKKVNNRIEYFGGGSTGCPSKSTLVPLTSNKEKLKNEINKMSASGGTAGHTGIAWGYYTLSPNWASLWNSIDNGSMPADYYQDNDLKFIVLMTDGEFNTTFRKSGEYKRSNWDWYCRSLSGWATIRYSGCGQNPVYDSEETAEDICDHMKETKNKNEKIRIYSVYFGRDDYSRPARLMKYCATDEDDTYYNAKSAEDLTAAFAQIAQDIKAIYLSK